MWTNISKPSVSSWTNISKPSAVRTYSMGQATGVLGPPTYSKAIVITNWSNIAKPTASNWTNIPKPT